MSDLEPSVEPGIASGPVTVRPCTEADGPAWDAFVAAAPDATFFHRFGWRHVLQTAFGQRAPYLIALRGERVAGVLPLVHMRSRLFGNALISTAYCMEGGPLAGDPVAAAALDQAASALMDSTGAAYLEYRSRTAARPDWLVKSGLYATFARPLSAEDKDNLQAIPRKQRAVVRKTLESALVSEVDEDPARFFRVYSESVRNLGTPMFPRRYFKLLKAAFGSDCDIVTILDGGEPVSAVLNFYFRDTVMPYYGGGTVGARRNGANDFLYWEVMRRAAARGYRRFDFGRSKAGTGAFNFKKNWGFEPDWLNYEYRLKPGTEMPEKNPLNPKYALMIKAWQKLPLPVANFIGPFLIRSLG
ncbi:MAG TPA: FemAB family XrtA/PEP-CTERM system-associated protein [Aliidongia sp.]|nr:FemAB family XrtA/PEP-CTERM system-associated protein [Aliidongia sp.]